MHSLLPLVALASLAGASTIQQPLINPSDSQAVVSSYESKPLVNSEALEAQITAKNLFKRAKQLFKIAKESIPEYNHPTRVIGSKGKLYS
jgi:aminopeptidase Y